MRNNRQWWAGLATALAMHAVVWAQTPGRIEVAPLQEKSAPPRSPQPILVPPGYHPGLPMNLAPPGALVAQQEQAKKLHEEKFKTPEALAAPSVSTAVPPGLIGPAPITEYHGTFGGPGGHPPFFDSYSSGIPDEMFVQVDALAWSRDLREDGLLRTTFQPFPGTTGDADDLSFDWDAGFRATVGWFCQDGQTFEVTYIDLGDWHAGNQFGINAPLNIPGTPVPLIAGSKFSTDYSSRLNSIEMNYRLSHTYNWSFLLGLRYIYTHENLQFSIDTPGPDARISARTDNNLFGPQLGGEYYYHCSQRLKLVGTGKLSLMANALSQRSQVQVGNTTFLDSADGSTDVTFLVELGAMVHYRFGEHWTLRGGYQMLLLEGLALAPGQFPGDGTLRVPERINADGNSGVLYHGLSGGLEFRW